MYAGNDPTFCRLGPALPIHPVLIAVPHAGRDYPDALIARATVSRDRLEGLEDRHADALIGQAVAAGVVALVATRPRCWLDLNRDEREIDPVTVTPAPPAHQLIQSAKLRGGLGLVPRRIPGAAELWRGPMPMAEMDARIARHHRPFHAAIALELELIRARFGTAMLIDLHTMPPLPRDAFAKTPQVVIGDRYGRSIATPLIERLCAAVSASGLTVARNAPYAGGYTLDRHGAPARGVHAVQVEIDRSLYLAPDMRTLGAGVAAIRTLVAALAEAAREAMIDPAAIAAE